MIIYKTTNLINNKIYIGQDSKNNPEYLGSGTLLKRSIEKYGKENFIKEILEHCETRQELNEKEIYWIKYHRENNYELYNITDGGSGGDTYKNNPNLPQILKSISDAIIEKNKDPQYKKNMSEGNKRTWSDPEFKKKMSEKRKGENNPMFGIHRYGENAPGWGKCRKVIIQYDLDMNFIKEYESLKIASLETSCNMNNIINCCKNRIPNYKNYIWKYKSDVINKLKEI